MHNSRIFFPTGFFPRRSFPEVSISSQDKYIFEEEIRKKIAPGKNLIRNLSILFAFCRNSGFKPFLKMFTFFFAVFRSANQAETLVDANHLTAKKSTIESRTILLRSKFVPLVCATFWGGGVDEVFDKHRHFASLSCEVFGVFDDTRCHLGEFPIKTKVGKAFF